jgi:hypothetical protein
MTRVLLSFMAAMLCFASSILAQDTTPPVITCPASMSINLDPGECEEQVFYNVTATDNFPSPNIYQIDASGLTSGDEYPIGPTVQTWVAADAAGNRDTCSFFITMVEYTPPTAGLVCDPYLIVSMPGNCQTWLLPAHVLEGNYGCYDDFFVNVNNSGSNYIGSYYVGKTVQYTVTNTQTGNWCWGNIFVEDKAGPAIDRCLPDTINCLEDVRPTTQGGDVLAPLFSDCFNFTVNYVDMVTQGDCNDDFSQQIMRIWTATDILGNVSTCVQWITIERVSLLSVTPTCPADRTVECVPGVSPNLTPAAMGYPRVVIDGITYDITDGANAVCNLTANYTDQIIPKCGVGYRIIRTWNVLDWCLPVDMIDNPWTCKQIIYYNDSTAPTIVPPANMTVAANMPGCRARPVIPASSITDCSNYTVVITTPVGQIIGNGGQVPLPGLPYGLHTITIKATDACGNSSSATFTINVVDNVKPVPVCDEFTVVSLDNDGYGIAYAETFDDGSSDNCCLDYFQVARLSDNCGNPANLVFDSFVEFCCADVGTPLDVRLRVWDCYGNFNDCTVEVEVRDETTPTIVCPPNITLFCGQDYTNLTITGEVVTDLSQQAANDGYATDNCGADLDVTYADNGTVTCGAGLIFRTWTATDPAGVAASCVQQVKIVNNNPFTGSSIIWPADITVYGCNAATHPDSTGRPTLPPASPCYTLVSGYTDIPLTSVPDACVKILRTWYVIDWCQYNPNNPTGPGRWERVQTIKVIDQSGPTFTNCNNRTFCNFKSDCGPLAPDLSITATDGCTPANQLTYTWTVDVNDDNIADPGYVTSGAGQNTTNNYPIGTHRISYAVSDGCGNTSYCNFSFTIEDCKKPTVYCTNGLIVEMMQGGMVDVSVMLLETGTSFDNCSSRQNLQFSFSPLTDSTVMTLTCAQVGNVPVQIWVTDEAGNQDYCDNFITLQDNMGACGGPLVVNLSGKITNEEAKGVEGVKVDLNGFTTGSTLTDLQGGYGFSSLAIGNDYTVTPQLNDNPLNGVTTFDIVLLTRHLLGLSLLDSPYKIIAADINRSGSVTVSDAVDLRKVILHTVPNFPNNTSWRFVDKAYTFPVPLNPFSQAFPEICNINNLALNSPKPDFIAVKVGDLNGTAATNLAGNTGDRSSGETFTISAPQRKVKAGEVFTVDFSANLSDLLAYQFTLNFDRQALAVENVLPGAQAEMGNFGLTLLDQGAITASWSQLAPATGLADEALFSIAFKALKDSDLSAAVSAGSRFTKAEAYDRQGSRQEIALRFTEGNTSRGALSQFELYQNVPNPFDKTTVIGFRLPEASAATLSIYDVSGKVVKEMKGEFTKGYHEIVIEKSALPSQGVYYYRLETPANTATMKMMLF